MISNFIKNIKLERDVEIKRWIRNIEKPEYTNAMVDKKQMKTLFTVPLEA